MPPGTAFAGAHSGYSEAEACIFGVPYDRTASFRAGAREAPGAIRKASYAFETSHFEHGRLRDLALHDYGDCDDFFTPAEMADEIRFAMGPAISAGKFTVVMGGDHSVSIPVIGAYEDVSVISIDAHLDSRREYMGLPDSHACVMRRAADRHGLDNVHVVGVRSISEEELDDPEPVPYTSAYEVHERGVGPVIDGILESLGRERVYVTLDIDGVDPAFAPGTGTPEPFGLTPLDVKKIINAVGDRLVGFDVVEVCPPYDPTGATSVLAARLIKEALAVFTKSSG
ncbi:MAG: agmatinase [Thermoplasmatales archaeon]|nr:agmatinase [Thermoplasmatales archaeon]